MRVAPLLHPHAARLPVKVIVNQASGFPWSNLITAVATVAAGLGGVILTQRDAQRRYRRTSRRQAYEVFILALDGLDRIWVPLLPSGEDFDQQKVATATNQAADQIQSAYVAVLLVGAARAKAKAEAVRLATWKLSDRVRPAGGQNAAVVPSFEQLKPLACDFRAARRTFIEAAEQELR
jgi:hypothetical protein